MISTLEFIIRTNHNYSDKTGLKMCFQPEDGWSALSLTLELETKLKFWDGCGLLSRLAVPSQETFSATAAPCKIIMNLIMITQEAALAA